MTTFMCFANWTDQGVRTLKDGPRRAEAMQTIVQKNGGKLLSAYITTGQYDIVFVVDMPNGEAMAKVAIATAATGTLRTTTVRAFLPEEFHKLVAEAI
jgi:uncharacterized protein with GYD domain